MPLQNDYLDDVLAKEQAANQQILDDEDPEEFEKPFKRRINSKR